MSDLNSLVTTNVVNIKIGEVVNKIPDASGLVKKTYWEEQPEDYKKESLIILEKIENQTWLNVAWT